jgi:hypothetical protein
MDSILKAGALAIMLVYLGAAPSFSQSTGDYVRHGMETRLSKERQLELIEECKLGLGHRINQSQLDRLVDLAVESQFTEVRLKAIEGMIQDDQVLMEWQHRYTSDPCSGRPKPSFEMSPDMERHDPDYNGPRVADMRMNALEELKRVATRTSDRKVLDRALTAIVNTMRTVRTEADTAKSAHRCLYSPAQHAVRILAEINSAMGARLASGNGAATHFSQAFSRTQSVLEEARRELSPSLRSAAVDSLSKVDDKIKRIAEDFQRSVGGADK